MKDFQSVKLSTVTTSGIEGGYDMNIDASKGAKLIMLLTQGLYSNPIGSMIREITSNCFDAHEEVGCDEPVIVRVRGDSELRFIDFGPGLSPKRVDEIYSKYLASTKESSRDQIGSWGLGSKSPLAYTDQFTILTRHEGTEYMYIMHKGEETTRLEKMRETKTNLRNGTEIIIGIKPGDLDKVKREISTQLRYFKNIYFDVPGIQKDYKIVEKDTFMYSTLAPPYKKNVYGSFIENTTLHVCLGGVAYPIDFSVLDGVDKVNFNVGIKFDIGDLPVTPNREAIIWSDSAKKTFESKYSEFIEEVSELCDSVKCSTIVGWVSTKNRNRRIDLGVGKKLPVPIEFNSHPNFSPKAIQYTGNLDKSVYSKVSTIPLEVKAYGFNRDTGRHQRVYTHLVQPLLDNDIEYPVYASKVNRLNVRRSMAVDDIESGHSYILKLSVDDWKVKSSPLSEEQIVTAWEEFIDHYCEDYDSIKPVKSSRGKRKSKTLDRNELIIGYPDKPANAAASSLVFREKYLKNIDTNDYDFVVYDMVSNSKRLGPLAEMGKELKVLVVTLSKLNFKLVKDEEDFIHYDKLMKNKELLSRFVTALAVREESKKYEWGLVNLGILQKLDKKLADEVIDVFNKNLKATTFISPDNEEVGKLIKLLKDRKKWVDKDVMKRLGSLEEFLTVFNNVRHLSGSGAKWGHLGRVEYGGGTRSEQIDFFKEYLTFKQVI